MADQGHRISTDLQENVRSMLAQGRSHRSIAAVLGLHPSTVDRYAKIGAFRPLDRPIVTPVNHKQAEFDWREWAEWAQHGQKLKAKGSRTQNEEAVFELGDGKPIILATFSDQHIGAWGCDYSLFCKITDEIVNTPNLYMVMLGDETEHAIRLRSVLEVTSQIFTPEIQERFIEAWIREVDHKIAWAGWSNHGIERQEKLAGSSVLKNLISRHATYFNGLAHVRLKVGKQEYKVASNHKFAGNSMYSRVHGPKRYIRMEAPDRDIVLQGDLHTPELDMYHEGGKMHVAITTGSLHTHSGYGQRHFSLLTIPAYPCIVLYPDEHKMVPFWSIGEAVAHLR